MSAWITVAELLGDAVADRLGILQIGRHETPQVDRFADAQEAPPAWPVGVAA